MKKYLRWFLVALLLLIVAFYLYPTPKKDAIALYDGHDRSVIDGLAKFRTIPTSSVNSQGADWTYVVLGKGPKTILFLHGMTGGYDFWWQQMNEFSRDYRVISVTYPPVDNLSALGKGIIAILDAQQIDSTVVIGSSLGGYLTQYLLATHPKRVTKAVFGNTFPQTLVYKEKNAGKVAVATWLPEWVIMNGLRQNLYDVVLPASENNPLAKAQLLENTYGRMSKAQFLARYHCVVDRFKPADGKQSGVPILIIESDNDPLVSADLRAQLKSSYPVAQVHTFHHKGHFPYLNAAGEYNDVLRKFLTQ